MKIGILKNWWESISSNSDFSDTKFWIYGRMGGERVKPLYGHQFYISFQAFWAAKIFLPGESGFGAYRATLFLSTDLAWY